MTPRRVLLIDDSVVVRRVLTEIVQSDPALEVAGTAATASIGIQKIPQVAPDVVICDVEMPEMDGIEAVRRIRAAWPRLPVIMCSSLTDRGADVTLRALAAGATDYVAKPSSLGGQADGTSHFRSELLSKIKALAGVPAAQSVPPPMPRPAAVRTIREAISVVAIGCSTGGPNALAALFADLPGDLPVPIVIVQHMPPLFTKILADRLSASTRVRVVEAREGDVLEPGKAYVAPGNFHMVVQRERAHVRIALNQETPENSCRPAVDVLFRSVARVYGGGVLGAVLTGMGQDGARGAAHIVEAGGRVIVQDAASCVVSSMPGAVIALGASDGAYPISRIGTEIVLRVRRGASPFTRREELSRADEP
jgi:two-component system chemotaxis response regulator CheB